MTANPDTPNPRITVRISKASLKEAEQGHDTAKLLKDHYETRVSAVKRFTERLQRTRGIVEPEWTAALREIGIADDEIDRLVASARSGLPPR